MSEDATSRDPDDAMRDILATFRIGAQTPVAANAARQLYEAALALGAARERERLRAKVHDCAGEVMKVRLAFDVNDDRRAAVVLLAERIRTLLAPDAPEGAP